MKRILRACDENLRLVVDLANQYTPVLLSNLHQPLAMAQPTSFKESWLELLHKVVQVLLHHQNNKELNQECLHIFKAHPL